MAVFDMNNRFGFMKGIGKNGRFSEILQAINSRSSALPVEFKEYFNDYINGVKQGSRNNDFYDDELLEKVVLEIINYKGYALGKYNPVTYFEKLISRSKVVFPFGTNTDGFELLKDLFVSSISTDTELFNDKLFTLFDDKRDYVDIIHLITADERLVKHLDKINEFALEMSRSVQNQDILKREIVSFLNVVPRSDNINTLIETRIADANKKYGRYDVDEKKLSLAVDEYNKARAISKKLDSQREIIDNHEAAIKRMSEAGKKGVADAVAEGISSIDNHVAENKEVFIKAAAESLKDVQNDMKLQAQKILRKEIEEASSKINEIKVVASGLASSVTDDMLRYQQQRDEINRMLDGKQIQSIISDTKDMKELKQLIEFFKANKDKIMTGVPVLDAPATNAEGEAPVAVAAPTTPATGFYIPGNERLVVPVSANIIIPETINSEIISAFDERIPFKKRFDAIKAKMDKMAKEGVIFHVMTEELIRCIMEGDWPYIWGASGCGKSYVVDQVGELLGLDVVDNGKITDKYSIMAYNDPHGRFRATPTFVAVVYGKLLKLDEFDNGNSDTHVVLNELYSKSWEAIKNPDKKVYVTFAEDMRVPVHPNFRMVGIGNTSGEGGNDLYSARGQIDESVQERCTPIKWFYDNQVEKKILADAPAWYDLTVKFRKVCDDYADYQHVDYVQGVITTRDADAIAKYIRHNSKSLEQVLREKFVQVKDKNYLNWIIEHIQSVYNISGTSDIEDTKKALSEYTSKELGKKLVYVANCAMNKRK
jgi:hypothetical protein